MTLSASRAGCERMTDALCLERRKCLVVVGFTVDKQNSLKQVKATHVPRVHSDLTTHDDDIDTKVSRNWEEGG